MTKFVQQSLQHQKYKDVLVHHEKMWGEMARIASENHVVLTKVINKISLSPYDDKRYVQMDGITEFLTGHVLLRKPSTTAENVPLDTSFDSDWGTECVNNDITGFVFESEWTTES